MGPYGSKKFKTLLPPDFIRSEPNFMINNVVIGEYTIMDILAICQKFKKLWHFEIFVNTGTGP